MSFGIDKPRDPTVSTRDTESSSFGSSVSNARSNSVDYGSNVWGPQAPYLQDVWGRAQGLADTPVTGGMNMANAGSAAVLQGLDPSFLQNAQGVINRQSTPGVNPMLDVYSRRLAQDFGENILPQIQNNAMLSGGRGGGRQGIAEGLAAARQGQNLQDFAAQLYSSDQDRALQAAGLGANIFGTAAGMVPTMGNFGMSVPWYNLNQYGGLVGGPAFQDLGGKSSSRSSTVASETSSSKTTERTTGGGGGGGFSFGLGS